MSTARLRCAADIRSAFEIDGADEPAAIRWTLRQIAGLSFEVEDDARWQRLCELVHRAADPWNADDWPMGFDPLLVCSPLCTLVSFECTRCPVGKRQAGMSCAHPTSAFGRIWHLIHARDRDGLKTHLVELARQLSA